MTEPLLLAKLIATSLLALAAGIAWLRARRQRRDLKRQPDELAARARTLSQHEGVNNATAEEARIRAQAEQILDQANQQATQTHAVANGVCRPRSQMRGRAMVVRATEPLLTRCWARRLIEHAEPLTERNG